MTSPEIPSPNHMVHEVENGVLDYFAGIAFDRRGELLVNNSDYSKTTYSTRTISKLDVYPEVFGFNHYVPYLDEDGDTERLEPATLLDATVSVTRFGDMTQSHVEFVSHTDNSRRLTLHAQDEMPFVVTHTKSLSKDFMTPYDAAELFFRAHNTDPTPYMIDVPVDESGYKIAHDKIRRLWNHSTENSGVKLIEHIIERESPASTDEQPVHHRFLYRTETPARASDTITMVYEKLIKSPALATETVYRLSITLISTGNNDTDPTNDAHRIIRSSGTFGITDISATHQSPQGVVRSLDTTDPGVMKEFVDAFDELVSLA